jgi:hypothetical protein
VGRLAVLLFLLLELLLMAFCIALLAMSQVELAVVAGTAAVAMAGDVVRRFLTHSSHPGEAASRIAYREASKRPARRVEDFSMHQGNRDRPQH